MAAEAEVATRSPTETAQPAALFTKKHDAKRGGGNNRSGDHNEENETIKPIHSSRLKGDGDKAN
jgi:hypothetical protein